MPLTGNSHGGDSPLRAIRPPLAHDSLADGFSTRLHEQFATAAEARNHQFRGGHRVPKPYKVFWQVVNTSAEARTASQLRSDFYGSDKSGRQREEDGNALG